QGVRRGVGIAQLLLHGINLLLQIGVGRRTASGRRTRGLFQFSERRVFGEVLRLVFQFLGGARQIMERFGAVEREFRELIAQFFDRIERLLRWLQRRRTPLQRAASQVGELPAGVLDDLRFLLLLQIRFAAVLRT